MAFTTAEGKVFYTFAAQVAVESEERTGDRPPSSKPEVARVIYRRFAGLEVDRIA